jgi:hypothetical protein
MYVWIVMPEFSLKPFKILAINFDSNITVIVTPRDPKNNKIGKVPSQLLHAFLAFWHSECSEMVQWL